MQTEVVIETGEGKKTRMFRALYLASIEADLMWSGGLADTNNIRPVWAMFAGSDQQMRAFSANLTKGKRAEYSTGYGRRDVKRIEILKSAHFVNVWQREAEGSIVTTYLPELFCMDPGMVNKIGASFIVAPARSWLDNQTIDGREDILAHGKEFLPEGVDLTEEDLARLVPMSFLFGAYLDRRTRCPLVADGRFYIQLLVECLKQGLASFPKDKNHHRYRDFGFHHGFQFQSAGIEEVGLASSVAFKADHTQLEELLSEQVSVYFQKVGS